MNAHTDQPHSAECSPPLSFTSDPGRQDLAPAATPAVMHVTDWGLTDYGEALERQRSLVEERRVDRIPDTLVFTEHKPVFTLGLRQGADQHLLWNEEACAKRGIAVVQTNRGGDITYHGPGQLVIYPIISLRERRDLHRYLRDLEETVLATLDRIGIAADRRPGKTGIWVQTRKLCAIGVAVRSWIAYHGLALNVEPDLSHFDGIVPCGITDGSVSSIAAEVGNTCPKDRIKHIFAVEFAHIFGKTLRYV